MKLEFAFVLVDYACQIFHDALQTGHHVCFLKPDTRLPMMYIDDCLRSMTEFLIIPADQLRLRTYNVHAMSFTPEELATAIRKYVPHLKVTYKPDSRQNIGQFISYPTFQSIHVTNRVTVVSIVSAKKVHIAESYIPSLVSAYI